MKNKLSSLLFFLALFAYSQSTKINNYQYIIVADKFDYLKTSDQYQTSSLTKFLLKKKGFNVFLSTENLPSELLQNRCLALTASVADDSGIFTVKNKIELKDCFGTLLYSSKFGKSKEKEYKKAYQEAIRNAYASMTDLEYNFTPIHTETIKNELLETGVTIPVKKDDSVKIIPQVIKGTPFKQSKSTDIVANIPEIIETVYAQEKPYGFQLVNTTPAIVFQILKTNLDAVFILKDKNGVFYKKGKNWIAEYYIKNQIVQKEYQVKF
jgi:hypothetical protein